MSPPLRSCQPGSRRSRRVSRSTNTPLTSKARRLRVSEAGPDMYAGQPRQPSVGGNSSQYEAHSPPTTMINGKAHCSRNASHRARARCPSLMTPPLSGPADIRVSGPTPPVPTPAEEGPACVLTVSTPLAGTLANVQCRWRTEGYQRSSIHGSPPSGMTTGGSGRSPISGGDPGRRHATAVFLPVVTGPGANAPGHRRWTPERDLGRESSPYVTAQVPPGIVVEAGGAVWS